MFSRLPRRTPRRRDPQLRPQGLPAAAQRATARLQDRRVRSIPQNLRVYGALDGLYREIDDALGDTHRAADLAGAMRDLVAVKFRARAATYAAPTVAPDEFAIPL